MSIRIAALITAMALLATLVACPTNMPAGNDNSSNGNGAANDNSATNDNSAVNDNGAANVNANGGDERACDDGAISLFAELMSGGAESGSMAYREFAAGCREFVVSVQGFAPGDYEVTVAGESAGQIAVGDDGGGLLFYDSTSGTFPADFPEIDLDHAGDVAGLAMGVFEKNCPAAAEVCIAGGGTRPAETCMEGASSWITTQIVFNSRVMRPSACTNVKEELETRLARVSFVNNHPTRTVAIAAIMTEHSDRRMLPLAPCDFAVGMMTFQSVQQCLERLAAGCDSPPGLFLSPGQTSGEWLYTCMREDLFPGSGICGEMQLETTTTRILAHAVFCDDFDTAMSAFCDTVHPRLLTTGMPVPAGSGLRLGVIQRSDCPDGG